MTETKRTLLLIEQAPNHSDIALDKRYVVVLTGLEYRSVLEAIEKRREHRERNRKYAESKRKPGRETRPTVIEPELKILGTLQ